MTSQPSDPGPLPAHDDPPWWRVTAVFDPDGTGQDFAYTVGLHERGLPELHLWARPTDGDDPGPDWVLSTRDCGVILNDAAQRLLAGRLARGQEIEWSMDGGAATVRFTVGAPVDRFEVDAFGVDPAASVLPLRWSLHREAAGPRRELDPREAALVRSSAALMLGGRSRRIAGELLPAPGRGGGRFDLDPSQRFGPRHAAVVARAGTLVRGTAEVWLEAIGRQLDLELAGVRTADALALAAARPVGLVGALDEIATYAAGVAGAVTGSRRPTRVWSEVLEVWDDGSPGLERRRLHENLAGVVSDVARHVLQVEALGLDAPDRLVRVGLGPWAFALGEPYQAPDRRWQPDSDALRVLREWFGTQLVAATAAIMSFLPTSHAEQILSRARAVCVTEGTAPPPLWPWLRGSVAGDILRDQPTWPTSQMAETALVLTSVHCAPYAFDVVHRRLLHLCLHRVPGGDLIVPDPLEEERDEQNGRS